MRWGSADTFVDMSSWGFRMGRPIANESFFRALLTYGTYESYDIFCPDVAHMHGFQERLEALILDKDTRARVNPSVHVGLGEAIATREYGAFHFGDFTSLLPYVVSLRNRKSATHFPISGITHSLDGALMSTRYLQLAHAGLQPYDAIVATSACARETVSKGLAWAYEQLGTSPPQGEGVEIATIPLALDETAFSEDERGEARAFFRIPENKKVALSVGRFTVRHKGDWAPILERISQMVRGGGLDDVLIIVAGGAEEPDIALFDHLLERNGLKEIVIPFPNFKPEVKPLLYRCADFYFSLVDNFQETFGITNLEAMAAGLPVIASSFSGYRDVVLDGETGFLVPTFWGESAPSFIEDNMGILVDSMAGFYFAQSVAIDLEMFEKAFRSLCDDTDLRQRMGEAGKNRAKEFTWPRIIGRYEALWSKLRQKIPSGEELRTRDSRLVVPPGHLFSHYTSDLLTEDIELSLSTVGEAYRSDRGTLTRYEDVEVCLFDALESFILDKLNEGVASVGTLHRCASEDLGADRGQTDFHLLWLLKHGVLTVQR